MTSEHNFFTDTPNFIEVMSFPASNKQVYTCVKNRSKKTANDLGVWHIKYKSKDKKQSA